MTRSDLPLAVNGLKRLQAGKAVNIPPRPRRDTDCPRACVRRIGPRGMRVGGVRDGERLYLSFEGPAAATLRFDFARHRRVLNFDKNYVRLNEFPEWYTVDENTLYRERRASAPARERVLLGSELIAGIVMEPGDWIVEPLGQAPYARQTGAKP